MSGLRFAVVWLSVLAASAAPAAGGCADDPNNLLAGWNCDFAADDNYWGCYDCVFFHEPADGYPERTGSGLAHYYGPDVLMTVFNWNCLPASPSTTYTAVGRFKSLGLRTWCHYFVYEYTAPDCLSGWVAFHSSPSRYFHHGWNQVAAQLTTSDSASVYLKLVLNCGTSDVLLDEFYLRTGGMLEELFRNGFEDGDTGAWAVVEGLP